MYFFVLLVCLQGEPQCVPMVEDPPVFYDHVEDCKAALQKNGEMISKLLEEEKKQGTLAGQCLKDESVIPT